MVPWVKMSESREQLLSLSLLNLVYVLIIILIVHYIFFIPPGTHNLARNVILPDLILLLSIPVLIESEVLLLVQFFPQITPSLPMK